MIINSFVSVLSQILANISISISLKLESTDGLMEQTIQLEVTYQLSLIRMM